MKIPKNYSKELKAMRTASKHNLLQEYKYARKKGYTIDQSLMAWDLYEYKPTHKTNAKRY